MRIGLYFDLRNPEPWRRPWAEHYARSLERIEEELARDLERLNDVADELLDLRSRRELSVAALADAHLRFLELSEPLIDDAVFDLVITGARLTRRSSEAIAELVGGRVDRIHRLLEISALTHLAVGLLNQAAHAGEAAAIQPLQERFVAAAGSIERHLESLPDFERKPALARSA